ncbi:hypothetical protein BGX26_004919 [Mortierella sp. AD094]|nr:hypothetical protein BGX26_004919 [Mortierella sp. AD094]
MIKIYPFTMIGEIKYFEMDKCSTPWICVSMGDERITAVALGLFTYVEVFLDLKSERSPTLNEDMELKDQV